MVNLGTCRLSRLFWRGDIAVNALQFTAVRVATDDLLFNETERNPSDDLRLQFEAIGQFDADDKQIVKAFLNSLILKHQPAAGVASRAYCSTQQKARPFSGQAFVAQRTLTRYRTSTHGLPIVGF